MSKKRKIEYLDMNLNLDTMIGIVSMHVCGIIKPIPRGYKIFKAELHGTQLTLYLNMFFKKTLDIGVSYFGLPSEIPAQIYDWNIDMYDDVYKIVQLDDEMNQLSPIPIINKIG
ncbi:MAG: hypothetical protein WC934_02915 [Acidithiobacillus sp.]|jgi:hypothetical protein|uniref:hypothetical protein n=1 Tax=Acidithiobacillus sp. TaxID=1872118 RepID=UPI00355CF19F